MYSSVFNPTVFILRLHIKLPFYSILYPFNTNTKSWCLAKYLFEVFSIPFIYLHSETVVIDDAAFLVDNILLALHEEAVDESEITERDRLHPVDVLSALYRGDVLVDVVKARQDEAFTSFQGSAIWKLIQKEKRNLG